MYRVSDLANIAGVSTRTLQYYDTIGLLEPAFVGENGYRYYDETSALNLQQILFYKELGLSLNDIKSVMRDPSFNIPEALEKHKVEIGKKIDRLQRISKTIDKTISGSKGGDKMSDREMFSAFSEEEQKKQTQEAEKIYDPEIVRASNSRWKKYSEDKKKSIKEEGSRIYSRMVSVMEVGAESDKVQDVVEKWRKYMDYFWSPNLMQLKWIAENYSIDPGFKANFEKIHPDLAVFFGKAVNIYVERHQD